MISIDPGSMFKAPQPLFPNEVPESHKTTPPEKVSIFKIPAEKLRILLKAVELADKVDGDPFSKDTSQERLAIDQIPLAVANWDLDVNHLILELSAYADSLKARRANDLLKK